MYKKMDAAERCEQLQRIDFQLDVLEKLVAGPFVAGGCCGCGCGPVCGACGRALCGRWGAALA